MIERVTLMGHRMYSLRNAKEEIDAVAKHAMDLADHVLAKGNDVDAKLENFKTEILKAIEAKFADLQKAILGGDDPHIETSAVADLGAKVSLLIHGPAEPPPYVEISHDQGPGDQGHHDQGYQNQGHQDQGHHDQGYQDQGHQDQGHHDQGTKIKGTKIRDTTIKGTKIKGTKIKGTKIRDTKIRDTTIRGTKIKGTKIKGTKIRDTTIRATKI